LGWVGRLKGADSCAVCAAGRYNVNIGRTLTLRTLRNEYVFCGGRSDCVIHL
jgi:hypothetical protein